MAKGAANSITDGKRFGIVPADVLTDKDISRSARWLFAVLCSHADKKGYCRRSLKRLAKTRASLGGPFNGGCTSLKRLGVS